MKPVNLAAQLAAAETELACLKIALGQVKEDREELRRERDAWRREATKLYAEKLIAEKLIEADEGRFAPRSAPHGGDAAHLSHWPDDAVQRPRDAADRRGRFKRFMHQG